MPFVSKLTEEQQRKLVVDYEDGFKIVELAPRYEVSVRTVTRILARAEIPQSYHPRRKRKKPKKSDRELKPCGTNAAYRRHKRKGEYPCVACVDAHNEDARNRKGN